LNNELQDKFACGYPGFPMDEEIDDKASAMAAYIINELQIRWIYSFVL
jgi:hypothetical protein